MPKTKDQPKKPITIEKGGKTIEPDLVVPATLDEDAAEGDSPEEGEEEAGFIEMDSFDDDE
jgi:hypothetical protein